MATLPGNPSNDNAGYAPPVSPQEEEDPWAATATPAAPIEPVERGEPAPQLLEGPTPATRPEPQQSPEDKAYEAELQKLYEMDPTLKLLREQEAQQKEPDRSALPVEMKQLQGVADKQRSQEIDQERKLRTSGNLKGIALEATDVVNQKYLADVFKRADVEAEKVKEDKSFWQNMQEGFLPALYTSGKQMQVIPAVFRARTADLEIREIDRLLETLPGVDPMGRNEGGREYIAGRTREDLEARRKVLLDGMREEAAIASKHIVEGAQVKMPDSFERLMAHNDSDFSTFFSVFMEAPLSNSVLFFASSAAQMVPGAVGAAVGTLATGNPIIGGAVGSYAANLPTMYLLQITADLQKRGVDITDIDALDAAFRNKNLMDDVYEASSKYAAVVAAFDSAAMGVAGKMLVPTKVMANRLIARELVNIGAQTQAQAVLGAAGEVFGTAAAYGVNEINWNEAFIEGVVEMVGAPGDVLTVRGAARARANAEKERLRRRLENRKQGIEPNEAIRAKEEADAESQPPEPATDTGDLDDSALNAIRQEAENVRQELVNDGDIAPEEAAPPEENTAEALKEEVREAEEVTAETTEEGGLADSPEQAIEAEASPRDLVMETISREEKDRVAFTKFESEARKAGDLDLAGMEVDVRYTGEDGQPGTERMSAKEAISLVNSRLKGITQLARCLG